MRVFGTVLPFVQRVIMPCDANGVPIATPEEEAAAHFETRAVIFGWLGFFMSVPFGDVEPRAIDPENPRSYLVGNL